MRWLVWLAIAMVALPVLALVLFRPVENWRGKRAWEKCKKELAAKGEVLDWDAYIPPPVPDEQNVFKAPRVAEWFAGRATNELVQRLDVTNLLSFCRRLHSNAVIELSVVGLDENVDHQLADLVLRYDPPVLSRAIAESLTEPPDPRFVKIPLVQFQDVPWRIALQNLARQAGVNYIVDPKVSLTSPDQPEPTVTFKWQDVTALQVLVTILNNYGLQWVDDPKTGIGVITWNNPGKVHSIYVDNHLRQRIKELIQNSLPPGTVEGPTGKSVKAAQGFEIALVSLPRTTPARVILKADKRPTLKEVVEYFPTNVVFANGETMGLQVEAADDGFRVLLNPSSYSAADYLAWSDQFVPDFEAIREALKRPHARLDGDYRQPDAVFPNYFVHRLVTLTLSQRAQCFLLLNQPDEALRELTLIHKLKRSLEGKPNTLVGAMIETAISGLHVEVVAEGLRRGAWCEPQLVVIQEQLRQINLLPLLAESLRSGRAGLLRTLESAEPEILADYVNQGKSMRQLRLMSHRSWLPRGWLQQNYVVIAHLQQTLIESVDVTNHLVVPAKTRLFSYELGRIPKGFRPHTFVATHVVAGSTRAVQCVAFQQVCADETQVACALERHRLVDGELPETLEALCPRFLDKVPHDIISGQPLKYRREGNTGFVIYSVGWNETDEGGIAPLTENGMSDMSASDWVWQSVNADGQELLTAK